MKTTTKETLHLRKGKRKDTKGSVWFQPKADFVGGVSMWGKCPSLSFIFMSLGCM